MNRIVFWKEWFCTKKIPNGYELLPLQFPTVLHLCGAWDFTEPFVKRQQADKKIPNSVMLRTSYYTDEIEVDEVQWRVGWNQRPKLVSGI